MALEIQTLKQQLQNLIAQRDQVSQNYQQYIGAISILQEQIKMVEAQEEETNKEISDGGKMDSECNQEAGSIA